jgi:hypothetical protein
MGAGRTSQFARQSPQSRRARVKVLAMSAATAACPSAVLLGADRPGADGPVRTRRALQMAACLMPALALCAALAAPSAQASAVATVVTATAPSAVSVHYEEESLEAFEAQLRAAALARAEFNKVAHHLHLTLRDGRHMLVDYPGHEQPQLQAKLLAAGVPVTIEYTPKAAKPAHHTLRYVAAGALVVVVVVLGVLLVARRRRLASRQQGGGVGAEMNPPSSE